MDTIMNDWIEQEKLGLETIFELMEEFAASDPDDDKVTLDIERRMMTALGHERRATIGTNVMVIPMIDGSLEMSRGQLAKYGKMRIEKYRKMLGNKARWGQWNEAHDIVINLHMKRVHEERHPGQLDEIMRQRAENPLEAVAATRNLIDTLEIDDLGLHIAAKRAEIMIPPKDGEDRQGKIERVQKALAMPTGQFSMPGMMARRGIHLTINLEKSGLTIEGNIVTMKGEIPDSVISGARGLPLHRIIDVHGYENDDLTITDAKTAKDEIILQTNRDHEKHRVRLEF